MTTMTEMSEAARLSRRGLVQQIDDYRAEKGWPAHGWGGEQ